ncbi:MAG: caspase family protein, partial [Nannocystaceae bacterium]|nr:caspase family protein [Nannocystaceae bacterium]
MRLLVRHLVAGLIVSACATPRVAVAKKTVAVVVGNNQPPKGEPGEGLATLRYADDDAHRYADLFKRFADDTVLLTVYDRQTRGRVQDAAVQGPPTLAALRKTLTALAEDEELTVYLVFSGHGAIDEAGAPFLSLLDGPLTRDVLFDELLTELPADRVHLIIDACH